MRTDTALVRLARAGLLGHAGAVAGSPPGQAGDPAASTGAGLALPGVLHLVEPVAVPWCNELASLVLA